MKASLFYLPSIGSRAEIEAGMAGMRPDLYQRMLRELSEQIKLADELGYDSVSFTEHHFHIEGFEVSQNPVLLDLYFAMQTKRIRVGQLGIVLPAANPIRVAEDIAMLDHMTGGRAVAGFARGYQRRWVDIMAQQTHGVSGALPHQHDEIDAANRAAFEENFQIIKKAWTEEMLTFDGKFWKIPAGETPWTLDTTTKYGKGVENGMLRSVGVVPKPLQKPYPDMFLPFASSENSIRWAAKEGVTAILPAMLPVYENHLYDVYAEVSGRPRDARHRAAARRGDRRHGRGGDGAVARLRPVHRPGVVRAVRLPARHAGPEDRRLPDARGGGEGGVRSGRIGRYRDPRDRGEHEAAGRAVDFLLHLQQFGAAPDPDEVHRTLLDPGHAAFHLTPCSDRVVRPGCFA